MDENRSLGQNQIVNLNFLKLWPCGYSLLVGLSKFKFLKLAENIYLQLSNFSSMEGVLYCKPHFEQLFKQTGNYSKSFVSRMPYSFNKT